jgi:hypothetical protein
MRTDDLIRVLAADNATRRASIERWLVLSALAGLAVSVALFAVVLGPRPDISLAAAQLGFWLKYAVTLTLAAAAAFLAARITRPGSETTVPAIALVAAPMFLAVLVVVELAQIDPSARMTRLVGTTWWACLASIPFLSAPILIATLFALRHGAPTRPMLAGAVAGLLAGGLGAAVYAAHCIEDSPLFLATWYTLAVAGVTLAGALCGSRLLRW